MATLTEMRVNVRLNTGSSVSITDAMVDNALKKAERRINNLFDFPEFEVKEIVTITGDGSTNEWTIGTTAPFDNMTEIKGQQFYSIIHLKTSSIVELKYFIPKIWDREILPQRTLIGDPFCYTLWNNKIQIWKIPTNTETFDLQCRYLKWPTFPATVGASFETLDVDAVLESLATSYVFLAMEEMVAFARWMNIFKVDLGDFLSDRKRFLNYEHSSKSERDIISSNYWADPFAGKMP